MIYLHNHTEAQQLLIPRAVEGEPAQLILTNTIDHDPMEVTVSDIGSSNLYFLLAIELPSDLPDGEYEYELEDGDGERLSTGIIALGVRDALPRNGQFDEDITYEQFNG